MINDDCVVPGAGFGTRSHRDMESVTCVLEGALQPQELCLIVDSQGRAGAVPLHQDVQIYSAVLAVGEQITYDLPSDRFGWVQVAQGIVEFNGEELRAGDGVQILGGQLLEFM
jgi:redox-sensitive bicupin YhaK (pirin superfamily)